MNSIDQKITDKNDILFCGQLKSDTLAILLQRYSIQLVIVQNNQDIPGSYWGDSEAGLIDNRLYVRPDTPVHSALHEACHYICMDSTRRQQLNTDAGGGYDEENAVCYLQILLSNHIDSMGENRMFSDMDSWGYSFRLGSSRVWFENDAEDARKWLQDAGLIDKNNVPTWKTHQ